jgi:peroxiredoxin
MDRFYPTPSGGAKNSLENVVEVPTLELRPGGRTNLQEKKMKRLFLAGLTSLALALPATAALQVGAKAPDFTAQASIGGKEFTFKLAEALKKGPVVLYFYPAAFTPGCTIEAHNFADATDDFAKMGATVIGVSHDDIAKLDQFSTSECRSKFAVAADPDQSITKAYDSILAKKPEYADRTSYVIAPDGKILMTYTDLKPDEHVARTMKAVQDWKAAH